MTSDFERAHRENFNPGICSTDTFENGDAVAAEPTL